MKKLYYAIILAIALIPLHVNASLKYLTNCDNPTKDENHKQIKTCYIAIELTEDTKFYDAKGALKFTNTSLKGNVEAVDSRVRLINNDPDNLSFLATSPLANETIKIAKFTIYLGQEDCKVTWKPGSIGINYVCQTNNGYYYDKNGNIVSATEYDKQCNTHSCQIIDGTYFDKNGNIVSATEYDKQCNTHTCQIIDGTYFDKNGNVVSQTEYDKQCISHSCQIIDGTYFDKNGNIVSATEYNKQCISHYCEIVDNIYFGKDGVQLSKIEWENQCTTPGPVTGANFAAYIVLASSLTILIISKILIKKIRKVHKI